MAKIRVVTVESTGLTFDVPSPLAVQVPFSKFEIEALVSAGIWGSPDDPSAWSVAAADGSIWAGSGPVTVGGSVAKVRGKAGRRLGQGRWPKAEGEGKIGTSVSLNQAARNQLEHLSRTTGKSMAEVVEVLILATLPETDKAAGA